MSYFDSLKFYYIYLEPFIIFAVLCRKQITSLWCPSPCHCAKTTQLPA